MAHRNRSGFRLFGVLGAVTLMMVTAVWVVSRINRDNAPALSEFAESMETGAASSVQLPDPDVRPDEVATASAAESSDPVLEEGQATATPATRQMMLELDAMPVEAPLDPYHERFPSSRSIELVRLNPPGQQIPWIDPSADIQMLELPLPGGDSLPVEVVHHEQRSPARGTFIAHAIDWEYSEVIVSYYDEAMTASIILPGQGHFEIAYAGDGLHLLIEVDPDRIAECGGALVPDLQALEEEDKEEGAS